MNDQAIEDLHARLRGTLIQPADEGYDQARSVYNAMHDRRPALIVQATDTADVVAAVDFARDHELLLAVRGGGHSVPGFGTCDDGLVLDLGKMNSVHVDPSSKHVRAGGGCTLGDLDHATHAYGLAVPGGTVSTTGLAGLTLGGGVGHLSRAYGLSCDNLVSAEVVTAAGQIVSCDASRHPELFWALRGGGGNFAVVTSFLFRAHPVNTVLGGPTFFRIDGAVMRNYESLMRDAAEELNALCAIALAPPAPFVPEEWHNKPVMSVLACWCGSEAEDENIPRRIAELGEVVGQALWRMPYPEINTFFDELLPAGLRHYWKASTAIDLPDGAISAHLEHGPRVMTPEAGLFMFPINGACHQVDDDATAFANRNAMLSAVITGTWHEEADDETNIRWVRDYFEALKPWSEAGAYVNFMSGDDREQANASYGAKFQRLRAVKQEYDPDNLFRVNHNIEP
jgi:FAD/FMN-containing dehydrogenase